VLNGVFGLRKDEIIGGERWMHGGNFVTCASHQIMLGRLSQEGWAEWCI
jgi:hypothetical protein